MRKSERIRKKKKKILKKKYKGKNFKNGDELGHICDPSLTQLVEIFSKKRKKKFLKKKTSKAKISKMVRNWAIVVTRVELNSSRSFRKSEKKIFEKKT